MITHEANLNFNSFFYFPPYYNLSREVVIRKTQLTKIS